MAVFLNFRLFYILLISCFWTISVHAYFEIGDVVNIADEHFEVIQSLGKGGIKKTYHARKVGCKVDCDIVIGAITPPGKFISQYSFDLQDTINNSPSIHLRREFPMLKATVDGISGETYIMVMEYGAGSFDQTRNLSKVALRMLMEDAYTAVSAIEYAGVVNTDIKPSNLMIMGSNMSDDAIKNGSAYLAIADDDFLYASEKTIVGERGLMITPVFAAPEFFTAGHQLDNKSSLWQVSSSFYEKLTGEVLFTSDEIVDIGHSFLDDDETQKFTQFFYEKKINLATEKLDKIILEHKVLGQIEEAQAMEEIKKLILNGFKLDTNSREYWPKGINKIHRKITNIPKSRLNFDSHISVRTQEKINFEELEKFFNEHWQVKRHGDCSVNRVISEADRSLLSLFMLNH